MTALVILAFPFIALSLLISLSLLGTPTRREEEEAQFWAAGDDLR